jgi:hypothetical protein
MMEDWIGPGEGLDWRGENWNLEAGVWNLLLLLFLKGLAWWV